MSKTRNLKHGEDSKQLQEFKKKVGLVTKEEINRLPINTIKALQAKIDLMDKYSVSQQKIVEIFGAIDGRVVNALSQVVDLQGKLWELEEKLLLEGESPLENDSYMRARDMLRKQTEFIHKQGLDIAKFQYDKEKVAEKINPDDLFKVVAE